MKMMTDKRSAVRALKMSAHQMTHLLPIVIAHVFSYLFSECR
jgi:hypothetical protein